MDEESVLREVFEAWNIGSNKIGRSRRIWKEKVGATGEERGMKCTYVRLP